MTRTLRIFVNAVGVDVPPGASVIDAVRAFDAGAAEAVTAGAQVATDSRGLPIDPATPVAAGAILRLIPGRARDGRPTSGASGDAADDDVE